MATWKDAKTWIEDEEAFIFSTEFKKIYRITDKSKAIFCNSNKYGPSFGGNSLRLDGDALNEKDKSQCFTNGYSESKYYNIKNDANGNNEVTGEGKL